MIENLKEKLVHQRLKPKNKEPTNHKWIPFTYFSPAVRKIANLFKDTNIKIAFRSTNTTYKQLAKTPNKAQIQAGSFVFFGLTLITGMPHLKIPVCSLQIRFPCS